MQIGFQAFLSVLKSEDSGGSSQRLDIWGRDHCPWSQAGVVGMQMWELLVCAHVFKYVSTCLEGTGSGPLGRK